MENENLGTQNQETQNQETNKTVDYEKLEQIINKGIQSKESAILKSYLEQQGLTEEEMKEAMNTYKTEKTKKQTNNSEALTTTQNELETYKQKMTEYEKQIKTVSVEKNATLAALELGVDIKNIPYILKLSDMENVLTEKGEIDTEKIKSNINKVLEDIPAFKNSKSTAKIVEIGGKDRNENEPSEDDKMRLSFGLKPRK